MFCDQILAQSIDIIGSCNLPGKAWAVQASGQYAYVACDSSGLQIIDISDPADPLPVVLYDTPGAAVDIFISGDYAYLADYSSMRIIDISNPVFPVPAGVYQSNNVVGVYVNGDQAYIACGYYPPVVAILDISDPNNPDSISGLSFLGGAFDVCYSQNHLFVLSNETEPYANYLRTINIEDPQNPYISASVGIPGTVQIPQDIKINGNYAYIADRGSGIPVINIADPSLPVVVGSYNAVGDATGICINGEYAFICEYTGVIQMLNISDPENPIFYASGNINGPAFGIFANDDFIFAVDWYEFTIFQYSSSDIEEENLTINLFASQNYPNPFNSSTTIRYILREQAHIRIDIYDLLGCRVKTLVEEDKPAGAYTVIFDASNLSSGIYFSRIQAGDQIQTRQMVLLK